LNFERNGYSAAGYNIHLSFEPSFLANKNITIFDYVEGLVAELEKPRVIQVATRLPGSKSGQCWNPSQQKQRMGVHVSHGWARAVQGIMSKWCITGSNIEICS